MKKKFKLSLEQFKAGIKRRSEFNSYLEEERHMNKKRPKKVEDIEVDPEVEKVIVDEDEREGLAQ